MTGMFVVGTKVLIKQFSRFTTRDEEASGGVHRGEGSVESGHNVDEDNDATNLSTACAIT